MGVSVSYCMCIQCHAMHVSQLVTGTRCVCVCAVICMHAIECVHGVYMYYV